MPDHFRAFRAFTGEARWGLALDAALARVDALQTGFSRRMDGTLTGLVPDFAVGADTASPRPATADWYEGPNDGNFTYVAARVPWRCSCRSSCPRPTPPRRGGCAAHIPTPLARRDDGGRLRGEGPCRALPAPE